MNEKDGTKKLVDTEVRTLTAKLLYIYFIIAYYNISTSLEFLSLIFFLQITCF